MKFASKYLTLLMSLIVMSLSFSLTSCGDDDDDDVDDIIIGNWKATETYTEGSHTYNTELQLNINKNKKFTYTITESAGGMTMSSSLEGTWSLTDTDNVDILYLNFVDPEEGVMETIGFYVTIVNHNTIMLAELSEPTENMVFKRK